MPATYRVDKFTVPEGVRDGFWTHLRGLIRYFGSNAVSSTTGCSNCSQAPRYVAIVTIVQRSSAEDPVAAKVPVEHAHREAALVPGEFIERHGIVADTGN